MIAVVDAPDDATGTLRTAWTRYVSDDDRAFVGLLTRHREKHRRYHTVDHVAAVVDDVVALAHDAGATSVGGVTLVTDLAAVVAAALYHDAIYEPESPANERASARLAGKDLRTLGWADERIDRVTTMIEATSSHLDPPDVDTAVLFDADLAILGSDAAHYDRYTQEVRAEYRHVSDPDWLIGRARVLDAFLARDSIYATPAGARRWERSARQNISREAASLR